MEVKQISEILNDVLIPETTEDTEIFKDDLSNVATLGAKVTSDTTISLNTALKTIYDKVGQTIIDAPDISAAAFDILATDAMYGSILEKIRVNVGDFDTNTSWDFTENGGASHEEMFGYHGTDITAKYFNGMRTFSTKPYTVSEQAFRSAFTSREKMISLFGAIEQRTIAKRNLAINLLTRKTVVALIAEKLKSGDNVYDLLAEYYAASGDATATVSNWRVHEKFLVFASVFIKTVRDMLKQPTTLFNEDEYLSQAVDDNMRFYLLSDFAYALESQVYRTSYNDDTVRLSGYNVTPFWQNNGGKAIDYTKRSTIYAIPLSEGEKPIGEDDRKAVYYENVVGVIFNRNGCMVNAQELRTGVVHNDFDHWDNYRHDFNAGYFVDTGENAVVFTIGTPITITAQPTDASEDAGDTATFSVTATAATDLSYLWFSSTDGETFTAISTATSASYTTDTLSADDDGTEYYVEITDSYGNTVNSNIVKLTVTSTS